MTTIGFIGLGTMGRPMAANLLRAGYEVIAWNRTPDRARDLQELGAGRAESPLEAARAADIVITMVSDDAAIEQVYYGSRGVMEGLKPGTVVIDSSTISPETARRLAADAAARFCDFLDAPVTGSKPAAEDGTIVFMVGGSRETLDRVRPVLLAMGRDAVHVGGSGSGAAAKLANNMIGAANLAALAEGMALAAAAGIDARKFLSIIQSGGAASRMAELKGQKIMDGDDSLQFALSLMHKDLRLAAALSDSVKAPAPLLDAVRAVYRDAEAAGLGGEDLSALARWYEARIGKRIGDPVPEDAQPADASRGPRGERRRSERVNVRIPVMMSIHEWQQEGSFSGQTVEGFVVDLSDSGLQIASRLPLALDMFAVIYFMEESALPPITARIIRIERKDGLFHYGCLLSALPPYQRKQLETYINSKRR
jgi:3-hydroxyisobutyrate dehydrogenase and related beta-hydroxyacid dehydrogenases